VALIKRAYHHGQRPGRWRLVRRGAAVHGRQNGSVAEEALLEEERQGQPRIRMGRRADRAGRAVARAVRLGRVSTHRRGFRRALPAAVPLRGCVEGRTPPQDSPGPREQVGVPATVRQERSPRPRVRWCRTISAVQDGGIGAPTARVTACGSPETGSAKPRWSPGLTAWNSQRPRRPSRIWLLLERASRGKCDVHAQ
jgi:hypothetical protein